MKLTPLHDKVIIKPLAAETTTASGIIIPETANQDRPEQGEVIAVGPGKIDDQGNRIPMGVSVGQNVVFGKYGPSEITLNDEQLLICSESDILAIVE